VSSIATLVEDSAARHGSKACVQVYSTQTKEGITDVVGFTQFHEQCQSMARFLNSHHNLHQGDTIGILADNSLTYLLLVFGAALAGIRVLLVSTRTVPEHLQYFMSETECRCLFAGPDQEKLASSGGCQVVLLDSLLASATEAKTLDSTQRNNVAANNSDSECAIIMHTSGTTSRPRLVNLTHGNILRNLQAVEHSIGAHWNVNDSSLLFLPLFHGYTLLSQFLRNLYIGATTTLLQPADAPSPEVLLAAIKGASPTFICCVPWMLKLLHDRILDELKLGESSSLHILQQLKFIVTAGAPLEQTTGAFFTSNDIRLVAVFGLTEAAGFILHSSFTNDRFDLYRPIEDSAITFQTLDPASEEYELVLRESPLLAPSSKHQQQTAADGSYHTCDLFLPEAGAWAYLGRSDLIYNGPQGEKVNPVLFERSLQKVPEVQRVFVSGEGLLFNYALVELLPQYIGDARIRDELLATIREQINPTLEAPARVYPNDVIFLEPGLTLPLTPKGTVDRKAALLDLKQRLRDANLRGRRYNGADEIRALVLRQVRSYLGMPGSATIPDSTSLLQLGFDSLMTLSLRNSLQHELNITPSLELMLGFPGVDSLVAHLDSIHSAPRADLANASPSAQQQTQSGWRNILLEQVLFHTAHFIFPFPTFNISMSLLAPRKLTSEEVVQALQALESRHGILRSVYDPEGRYRIEERSFVAEAHLGSSMLQGSHDPMHNPQVQELIRQHLDCAFNLESGPVYRYALVDIQDSKGKVRSLMYFGLHHVAGDFKGFNALCGELMTELATPSIPSALTTDDYPDHAPSPGHDSLQAVRQCWLQLLTIMPTLKEGLDPRAGSKQLFRFDDIDLVRLADILRQHNISLYNGIYTVYALVAGRYLPGQSPDSFLTATAITSRLSAQTESLAGCFIHSPILRLTLDPDASLLANMHKVQEITHTTFARALTDPTAWLQATLADPDNLVPFLHRNVFLYRSPEEIVRPPKDWHCYRNELFFESCDVGMYFDFCANQNTGAMEGYVLINRHYCDPGLISPLLEGIHSMLRGIINNHGLANPKTDTKAKGPQL